MEILDTLPDSRYCYIHKGDAKRGRPPYIGILTASRNPELYHAYIAMSQITDQEKSEKLAYRYMLKQYQKSENTKMISEFLEVPTLEIPIYFLAGIYEYTCSYSLQRELYDQIQAPVKAFYTFYNSAHSPLLEEPEKAGLILREDVLTGSVNHADTQQ